jgi:Domain of Unknown Function (DUF1259)
MAAGPAPLDLEAISQASGTAASLAADGVARIAWARTDVAVAVDGAPLDPSAGLGSWAAFQATDDGSVMMGDTVVFEDELTPALDAALAAGLEVTAIHNHFVFDHPRVLFMHIGGQGDATALAGGVKRVWDAIRTVRSARPEPADGFAGSPPVRGVLDAQALAAALGAKPTVQGAIVKFSFGRETHVHGIAAGGAMGVSTWAAFSGSGPLASVDGDFVMAAGEVQPVLRALRHAGIYVVALHNHMLDEEPRLFFLHYWGKGKALELARRLRTALDAQADARTPP